MKKTVKGRGLLKFIGIIMIIVGIIEILACAVVALAVIMFSTLLTDVFGPDFINAINSIIYSGNFMLTLSIVLTVVIAITTFIAGIVGVKHSGNPEKYKSCLVWGLIVLILNIVSIVIILANGNSDVALIIVSCVFGIIIPLLFVVGALLNASALRLGASSVEWAQERMKQTENRYAKYRVKQEKKIEKLQAQQVKQQERVMRSEAREAEKQAAREAAKAARAREAQLKEEAAAARAAEAQRASMAAANEGSAISDSAAGTAAAGTFAAASAAEISPQTEAIAAEIQHAASEEAAHYADYVQPISQETTAVPEAAASELFAAPEAAPVPEEVSSVPEAAASELFAAPEAEAAPVSELPSVPEAVPAPEEPSIPEAETIKESFAVPEEVSAPETGAIGDSYTVPETISEGTDMKAE